MMALKERISSPLEAGPSILDAHHLPPHLTPALEYASGRLAKKSLHLTLVLVRRDYQLPAVVPSHVSPALSPSPTPSSPPFTRGLPTSSRLTFTSSPVGALKHLVRSASRRVSRRSDKAPRRTTASGYPPTHLELPKLRWPRSPSSPLSSPPPMTPSTTTSMTSVTTTETNGPLTPDSFSLRFLHPSDMSPQVERVMKTTIAKAGTKFGLGSAWLCPFATTSARELTDQLFQNSVVQNETLFSSDGLTLLALDRLYSVKSALSSYCKTGFPLRLEDAVDELRRHVLASNGGTISRSDLFRSYDWLSISNAAAADLDRMYQRAYGGPERFSGLSGMLLHKIAEPQPLSSFDDDSDDDDDDDDDGSNIYDYYYNNDDESDHDDDDDDISPDTTLDPELIGLAVTAMQMVKPSTPRRIGPPLTVQTEFDKSRATEEEEDRTARPLDAATHRRINNDTIDQVLSHRFPLSPHAHPLRSHPSNSHLLSAHPLRSHPSNSHLLSAHPLRSHPSNSHLLSAHPLSSHPVILKPDRPPPESAPMTPNGYDDISPITRSEWGFFIVDKGYRTAAVETC